MNWVLLILLVAASTIISSCKAVQRDEDFELKLAAACNATQHLTSHALSCGNNKCEKLLFENDRSCPEDCANPKLQISSYYAQAHVCPHKTVVHTPETPEGFVETFNEIRERGMKVKVVGSSHSITDIKCPDVDGEAIATQNLKKIIGIEDYNGTKTVHVESAVRFWELINWLDEQGYALDPRIPGMGVISVGGFIATGAHGSNVKGSGTISSSVVSLEMILADGSVKVFDKTNTTVQQWQALRANLGLLGIVTKVRLEVRPRYNMHTKIFQHDSSVLFSGRDRFEKAIEGCNFVFGHYLRGQDKVYFTCAKDTDAPISHNGAENVLFKPPTKSIFNGIAVSGLQQTACSDPAARFLEETIDKLRMKNPWLRWTDERGVVHNEWELTGPWHLMMETLFTDETQPRFSQIDWEVAIPMKHFDAAMKDMRDFMDKYNVIIPQIGVIFRFDAVNEDSLMAASGADGSLAPGERLVHIELPVYVPFEFTLQQQEVLRKPHRDFMTLLIEKYEARPHYGKNDNALFTHPAVKARMKSSLDAFSAVRMQMDPQNVFLNDYMRKSGIH